MTLLSESVELFYRNKSLLWQKTSITMGCVKEILSRRLHDLLSSRKVIYDGVQAAGTGWIVHTNKSHMQSMSPAPSIVQHIAVALQKKVEKSKTTKKGKKSVCEWLGVKNCRTGGRDKLYPLEPPVRRTRSLLSQPGSVMSWVCGYECGVLRSQINIFLFLAWVLRKE